MKKIRFSFKSKVLVPLIIVFSIATLIISWNFYRLLEQSVTTSTDEKLDIFTDSILTQVLHLDLILETTIESLAQKHLALARSVAHTLDQYGVDTSSAALTRLSDYLGINEFSVADRYGIIIYSNIESYIGFYYGSTPETIIYMPLADGTITVLQEPPRRSVLDDQELGDIRHYTGLARAGGGFIQLGFNADILLRLQEEINIERTISETKLGYGGYGFVLRDGKIIAHFDSNFSGLDVSGEDWYGVVTAGSGFVWLDINGSRYYAGFRNAYGHTVVGLIPEEDYFREMNQAFRITVLVFGIALLMLIGGAYPLVNRLMNDKMQAERAQRDLGDLVTSIAHDLKTPLSVLSLNLEALNNMAVNNAEYQRHTRVAYQKSQDLQRLIQNLFEVNRIERGKVAYNFKKVSMLHLFAEARVRYDDYLEDKGITFEISAPDDDMFISVDRQRIWSVFDNVIYNAARYTAHGGAITVSGENNNGNAVVTISDTGCGIPAEHLPHVFERFYKVSQARGEKDGDSGLGLYIVKNIMDGHGGSVTAVSEEEKGTAIMLTFIEK